MRDSAELGAAMGPAGGGCPVDHAAFATEVPVDHQVLAAAAVAADPAARCPVDHRAMATEGAVCPVARPVDVANLPSADRFMRKLLRIPDHPDRVRERDVQRLFSASITVSAIRCLLSYVVFPIVAPTVGAITKLGAFVGIPVGIVALIYDVRAVRRFWMANHRYRWAFTAVYAVVIVMVLTLFARDIRNLII